MGVYGFYRTWPDSPFCLIPCQARLLDCSEPGWIKIWRRGRDLNLDTGLKSPYTRLAGELLRPTPRTPLHRQGQIKRILAPVKQKNQDVILKLAIRPLLFGTQSVFFQVFNNHIREIRKQAVKLDFLESGVQFLFGILETGPGLILAQGPGMPSCRSCAQRSAKFCYFIAVRRGFGQQGEARRVNGGVFRNIGHAFRRHQPGMGFLVICKMLAALRYQHGQFALPALVARGLDRVIVKNLQDGFGIRAVVAILVQHVDHGFCDVLAFAGMEGRLLHFHINAHILARGLVQALD